MATSSLRRLTSEDRIAVAGQEIEWTGRQWRVDGQEAGDTVRSIYIAWNGWTGEITATLPAAASRKAAWR